MVVEFLMCFMGLLVLFASGALSSRKRRSSLPPPPHDYNFVHPPEVPCGERDTDLNYKVPLNDEQEQRALALYRKSIVVIAHTHCVEPSDFAEIAEAGVSAVVVKVDDDGINILHGHPRVSTFDDEDWMPRLTRELERLREMAAAPGARILIATSVADIHHAKREGKVAVILGNEGARPLLGDLKNLRPYYGLGLRELQLWWAVPNETKTEDGKRLTDFGEKVIEELNRLGILVDLSHMQPQAFARAIEIAKRPLVISHCAVGELYREQGLEVATDGFSDTDLLNDNVIRAVAANGGLICIHFVTPDYIRPRHGTENATIVDLVDHFQYVRDLVGSDHVAIGADFFPEEGWHFAQGAGRICLLPNVAREMVRRGFTDEEIEKILGGNLLRVFNAVWR